MQFIRFARHGSVQWGVRVDDAVHSLASLPREAPSYDEFSNPSFRKAVRRAIANDQLDTVDAADVDPLAPVPQPGKIVCVGLNYHDHAEEQDEEVPEKPLLFAKAPSAVTNPDDPIYHPDDVDQVDYEVELGVVVGRTASEVDAADAADFVSGYTVLNDVSARDAQFDDGQFFRGKGYDSFAPMGPTLVPEGEIDPNDLAVSLDVDGDRKQASTTAEFIFDVYELVEYVSHVMTLEPGDVISTGTPGGVGIFRDPPDLLEPGQTVTATVEGVGSLENPVVER